jgi:sulfate adenylyltransferase subunit 1 (EFTu-like GTPase family)
VVHRVDVESLATEDADGLALNEIGRVRLRLGHPIFADPYSANRATGCFVLIDQHSNDTVAAGIVRDA